MSTYRLSSDSPCPVCQTNLDGATNVIGEGVPEEGDLTICVYCGTPLIYSKDLTLMVLPQEILNSCPEEILHIIHALSKNIIDEQEGGKA